MSWTFLHTPPGPGALQMSIDRDLLNSSVAGPIRPVFRLYTWNPPAVSLGAHQDPDRDVDRAAAAARGVDVVVRPTGGRAIYHDEELTYAVVAGIDDPVFGGSIAESHAAISRVFLEALSRLGICAEMGPGRGTTSSLVESSRHGAIPSPCFDAATRTELTVNGRKILGSAQRRSGAAFLQHGSLLTGDAHLNLVDFLPAAPDVRARLRSDLERKTTTVAREAGRVVPLEELMDAVGAALGDVLERGPILFEPGPFR